MDILQINKMFQKVLKCFLGLLLLLCMTTPSFAVQRTMPVPNTVSPEMQNLIKKGVFPLWSLHPKNNEEWKTFVQKMAQANEARVPDLAKKLKVRIEQKQIAGVSTYVVTPENLPSANANNILLNFHGGGYVLGPGKAGLLEALYMAGIGQFIVVMPDYRLAPEHPYPAAMDDAMAVYKELLKTTPPENIGVFGTSTGGAMTLALILRAKAEGIALPAAIAAATPWSDLTKTGDSYFVNEGLDSVLVSYDGWLGEAAKVYAAGHDLKDPMLSPIYGDVRGFPPVMFTTGTRDLFLSNTVRMHTKLRMNGVDADLIVLEGVSHGQYHALPDAPETQFHFSEIGKFFRKHLQLSQ